MHARFGHLEYCRKFAGENNEKLLTQTQMDLLKTKIFLDKLNREFTRMSKDPENIVRLDVDIMASYVRELYDAVLSESTAPKAEAPKKQHTTHAPRATEPEPAPPPPPAPAPPAPAPTPVAPPRPEPIVPEYVAPPAPPAPPPPAPAPPAPAPPAPVAPVAPPAPVVVQAPEPTPQPIAPPQNEPKPSATAPGIEQLFEERQAKELSDKLSELPIADLKKAIALNDRLLLTRELFAGDGQAFESAIAGLNALSSFEQARQYLIDNCIVRYAWVDKKRLEAAKDFIRLVRRRYK